DLFSQPLALPEYAAAAADWLRLLLAEDGCPVGEGVLALLRENDIAGLGAEAWAEAAAEEPFRECFAAGVALDTAEAAGSVAATVGDAVAEEFGAADIAPATDDGAAEEEIACARPDAPRRRRHHRKAPDLAGAYPAPLEPAGIKRPAAGAPGGARALKRPAAAAASTHLCQGREGEACCFSASEVGGRARYHDSSRQCPWCGESLLERGLGSGSGKGNLARGLRFFWENDKEIFYRAKARLPAMSRDHWPLQVLGLSPAFHSAAAMAAAAATPQGRGRLVSSVKKCAAKDAALAGEALAAIPAAWRPEIRQKMTEEPRRARQARARAAAETAAEASERLLARRQRLRAAPEEDEQWPRHAAFSWTNEMSPELRAKVKDVEPNDTGLPCATTSAAAAMLESWCKDVPEPLRGLTAEIAEALAPMELAERRRPLQALEEPGVECALWPDLYWDSDCCETVVRATDARRLQRRGALPHSDSEAEEEEPEAKLEATAPPEGHPLRGYVLDQLSYNGSGWPVFETPSRWDPETETIRLQHSGRDEELGVRAFSPEELDVLKGHVDNLLPQADDSGRRGPLLRYVATYNMKFSDSFANEMLADTGASGYSLALRILSSYHPLEPVVAKVPRRYQLFACALRAAPGYWSDRRRIAADLEIAAHRHAYIANALALVDAQRALVEQYLDGTLSLEDEVPEPQWNQAAAAEGELARPAFNYKQQLLEQEALKRLDKVAELQAAENEADAEALAADLERNNSPLVCHKAWSGHDEPTALDVDSVLAKTENAENYDEHGKLREDRPPLAKDLAVYAGLRVVLTRNRDKENHFVNGMVAEVEAPRSGPAREVVGCADAAAE
ncbi:unnamed protein product, partial [Effrenium voratum]